MHNLAEFHPARLVHGTAIIAQDIATRSRQTTLGVLCRDAVEFASESCELFREVATDASALIDQIKAAAADGKIDADELRALTEAARQIECEAQSGLIES